MKSKFLSRLIGSVFIAAAAPLSFAHAINDMDDTLYLRTQHSVNLYLATELADGDRALTSQLKVPEDSIVAVDIMNINAALSLSKSNPDRLNYPYIPHGEKDIRKSQDGWVCGLRVVDVLDEEVRSSDVIDRADFCMSLADLQQTTSLESNGAEISDSFITYKVSGDISKMNGLASQINNVRRDRKDFGIVDKIAGESIISPLKDCGKRCLVVTSEYGMRKHPVLKRMRLHKGTDFRAETGSSVVSVFSGKVLATRTERNRFTKRMSGYGNYVIVVHPNNKLETLYAHLSAFKIKAGASVDQGEVIALSGNTGIGTAPHLHFETHIQGKRGYTTVNPRTFIGSMLDTLASLMKAFSFHA